MAQTRTVSKVWTCTYYRIKIEGTETFVLIDAGSMVTIVNTTVTKHCRELIKDRLKGSCSNQSRGTQSPSVTKDS